MTNKKSKLSLIALLALVLILLLSACGGNKDNQNEEDANLAITQVFETAMAALTQTAIVQPPTETPTATVEPTFTLAPTLAITPTTNTLPTATTGSPSFVQPTGQTSSCDIGAFVRDVTIPDGTTIAAGDDFTKTWEIKNNGTCTWNENYNVIYYSGEQMADDTLYAFTTEDIEPGESVNISVPMTAPTTTGEYYSYWVLRNDLGQTFFVDGGAIYVQIKVGTVTSATATATPSGNAPDVTINSPADSASYTVGTSISFAGVAIDNEDDDISGNIQWFDNNTLRYTGSNFSTTELSVGTHTIVAKITDSDGRTDSMTITITVTE